MSRPRDPALDLGLFESRLTDSHWAFVPASRRYCLRGSEEAMRALAAIHGWPAPERLLRARVMGDRATLWLGPDEWLLIAAESGPFPVEAAGSANCGCVEISDRQHGLEIAGAGAANLLNSACPLDLHPSVFEIDACSRSVFGRCPITVWRRDTHRFRIEVWRSYLPYVLALLGKSGVEEG